MSGLCKIVSGPNNGYYAAPKYFYIPCTLLQTLRTTRKIVKKHHVFCLIPLLFPLGSKYTHFGHFYVWNFFRGSRKAARRASIIKPILKMCSQTSNYPRRNISRVKNMLFLRFTKKYRLGLFFFGGGVKKTFPRGVPKITSQDKISFHPYNHRYFS